MLNKNTWSRFKALVLQEEKLHSVRQIFSTITRKKILHPRSKETIHMQNNILVTVPSFLQHCCSHGKSSLLDTFSVDTLIHSSTVTIHSVIMLFIKWRFCNIITNPFNEQLHFSLCVPCVYTVKYMHNLSDKYHTLLQLLRTLIKLNIILHSKHIFLS